MDSSNKKRVGLASGSIMVILARIATSLCAFALFWIISQNSVEQLGAFRTLFIYFLIAEFIPLLGMNQYVIRETAKHPEKINDFLLHAFLFSLIVSLFLAVAFFVISRSGGYSPLVAKGLLVIIIGIPATAAVLCLQSILIACRKGAELGAVQGIEVIIRTALGIWCVMVTQNIIHVMAGFIVTRWGIVILYWLRVSRLTNEKKWHIQSDFFYYFLKKVPQFAGILALFLVIRFAGQLMVPWMEGDVEAGYFAIVYQFLDLILLVPTSFSINFMPVLSRKAHHSIKALRRSGTLAMTLMATLMIPCTLFVFVNCTDVVFFIFGEQYQPAVSLVSVSIWAGLIFSFDQVLSTSMIAADKQGTDLTSLFIGALVTIVAMYFLITHKGVTGAAIGLLAGAGALFISRVILFNLQITVFNVAQIIWKQLLSGAAMAGVMYLTRFNFILAGFIGAVVYIAVLSVLGGFNKKERENYKELFGSN